MLPQEARDIVNQGNPETDPDMVMSLIGEKTLPNFLRDLMDDKEVAPERKQSIIDVSYASCSRMLQGFLIGKRSLNRDDKEYQEKYTVTNPDSLVRLLNEADLLTIYMMPMKYTTLIPEEEKERIEESVRKLYFKALNKFKIEQKLDDPSSEFASTPTNPDAKSKTSYSIRPGDISKLTNTGRELSSTDNSDKNQKAGDYFSEPGEL